MSVGTAFHPRTAPLNRKMQWREWAGYFASSTYADFHDIEYNAIREAAAVIDVSPLYKYRLTGPDVIRLADRVITRDATKLAVGQVYYTPWCDEHGKVIDDGTVHRVAEQELRWTAADPQSRWLSMNAAGLDVQIEDVSESVAALALQGPFSRAVLEAATGADFGDLRYFRRRAATIGKASIDVSRTGYTGDLGYELWIRAKDAEAVWDAIFRAGKAYAIRPAGMLALDVVRLEAGLIMLDVDYTSARHAMNPDQNYSPYELGLGKLVSFEKADYVGRRALQAEQAAGGPARRLVGLQLDWYGIEGLFDAQGLPPAISPSISRSPVPVYAEGRQVGKATSHGWSPIKKQALALAFVPPRFEASGSRLEVEWTVEGRRSRVGATVVDLPFLDLPPKARLTMNAGADAASGPAPTSAGPEALAAFDREIATRLDGWVAELVDYLAVASEGGDVAGLQAAADWTADRLRRAGAAVEVIEIDGVPPLVVGELGDGPRTLNAVQHYDVQPAEPLDLWTTPPYEPAVRDGRVFARGATDNKGEFLPRLWALEAWQAAVGPLPCRVRFLVEGQEETGSGALDALLDLRPSLRVADAALIEGGGLDLEGRPGVAGGGKGIIVIELHVRTMTHDAHSSLSVVLPNAGHRLVAALATFWDPAGRPAIEGLDVGSRPPSAAQLAIVAAEDTAEIADIRREWGVERLLDGLDGTAAHHALTFETTLNLQGLWAGHTERTPKTVTPAEAHARLDVRIVPDQRPDDVVAAIRRHLDRLGYGDIELVVREAERAWWTPPDHVVVQTAAAVSESVAGFPASVAVSMAGTVPMDQVCARHRVPATTLGAGRADCAAHAPDENIRIEDLAAAARMMGRFVDAFARLPEVPPVP